MRPAVAFFRRWYNRRTGPTPPIVTRRLPLSDPAASPPGRLVRVRWLDAGTEAGWWSPDAELPTYECETVGWLLEDLSDEAYVRLATTYHPGTREVADVGSIPRGCVLGVEDVVV